MGLTALWTATHYRLPCLLVVCNNRSFYNDEAHRSASPACGGGRSRTSGSVSGSTSRHRPGPSGGGAGREGHRPVTDPAKLAGVIARACKLAREGEVCVIDARVRPGYDPDISRQSAPRARACRPDVTVAR